MATIIISGATLALTTYVAINGYLAGLQHDLNRIDAAAAVLDAKFTAYNREREQWIERIKYLEARCTEIRERIGLHQSP
jgi:hypothetical protein